MKVSSSSRNLIQRLPEISPHAASAVAAEALPPTEERLSIYVRFVRQPIGEPIGGRHN
jgi:hypothetical protein